MLPLLTSVILFFMACQPGTGQNKLDADAFEKQMKATPDLQLVDVRTPEEFQGGHLQNALNIDYNGDNFSGEIGKLDKTKPTYVYCLSGGRSSSAAAEMRKMGFSNVLELKGGITGWKAKNKPVVTGEGAPKKTGMNIEEYNKLLKSDKLVLVDFGAKWCAPCRKLSPILDEIAMEKKDVLSLVKIDADEHSLLSQQLQVEFLPTLLLYKDEKLIWKSTGFVEKPEIVSHLNP